MKLFIPGPTEVHPEILAEMARPAIGHRTEECAALWAEARRGLGALMQTRSEVLMLTGPASAMMEACILNLTTHRTLHLVNGAFSKRWRDIAAAHGRSADAIEVEAGQVVTAAALAAALDQAVTSGHPYEVVTVVHNETSTGTTTPLQDFAAVLADHPNTLLCVDTVSSMGGMPVAVDAWGIDVCLFGLQKCLALPAGMAIASVSAPALERAAAIPHRGWFLDFLRLRDKNLKEQSPTTPSTAHLYALVAQLRRIHAEGLEARWARHRAMADRVRAWAQDHGWGILPPEGLRSDTVSCITRAQGPDFVPALEALKAKGILVSSGYGELKGTTFRIGHMGEHDLAAIEDLLNHFDAALAATVQ